MLFYDSRFLDLPIRQAMLTHILDKQSPHSMLGERRVASQNGILRARSIPYSLIGTIVCGACGVVAEADL